LHAAWHGVGSLAFVDKPGSELGSKAMCQVTEVIGTYTLREQSEAYAGDLGSKGEPLSLSSGTKMARLPGQKTNGKELHTFGLAFFLQIGGTIREKQLSCLTNLPSRM